jgi:hypothetical protein
MHKPLAARMTAHFPSYAPKILGNTQCITGAF